MQQVITITIVVICVAIVVYRIVRRFSRKGGNPCDSCAGSSDCGCGCSGGGSRRNKDCLGCKD